MEALANQIGRKEIIFAEIAVSFAVFILLIAAFKVRRLRVIAYLVIFAPFISAACARKFPPPWASWMLVFAAVLYGTCCAMEGCKAKQVFRSLVLISAVFGIAAGISVFAGKQIDQIRVGENGFYQETRQKIRENVIGKAEELAEKIRVMKAQGTHLCCSIGFLTEKQALMLKEAGLDRINHNLNSSRSYYHNICTTHTYEQRVNNIHMLQRLGFEICSGGIIGMGESKEDIVDMLLDLREIQPEALPINFLLPIPGTPLENADTSVLTPAYCMKVLCLARLMVPQSDIRCAAGREVYFKGREKELLSIVDSIFASGYLTADGQGISDTIKTITDAGFRYEIESD